MVNRYILFLLLWLLISPAPLLAGVKAYTDQTTYYEGDTITLTIEVENQYRSEPDLSALEQAFQLLGTGKSRQLMFINGKRSDKTSWRISLSPLTSGQITIPSLSVGPEQTQPISLTVKPASSADNAWDSQDIFLLAEAETAGKTPFVQQQIRFRVRLFLRLPLMKGELSDPAPENAIIERLGEGKRYRGTHGGREYEVIERNYAIFPEKSGEIVIPPITFQGRIITNGSAHRQRPRSSFDRFFQDDFFNPPSSRNSRPIKITSAETRLQVKPQPASYTGEFWLPSEQLILRDGWAENPPTLRAGEPVSRTILIEAKGLAASHVPQLELAAPDHLRIYPEQPETENVTDGTWVFGRSQQTFTYIPSQPGLQSLPEISLTWWDSARNQQRIARLPAWEVKVEPAIDSTSSLPAPVPARAAAESPLKEEEQQAQRIEHTQPWWWIIALSLLIVLSLAAYVLHRSGMIQRYRGKERADTQSEKDRVLNSIRLASQTNDAAAAAKAIMALAALQWPDRPPLSLRELAARVKHGSPELLELDRVLYGTGNLSWDGGALYQVLGSGFTAKRDKPQTGKDALQALYPSFDS